MFSRNRPTEHVQWLIAVIVIVLSLTAALLPGARTIDDSYITFRYARNLLAGDGFVFNPGDRVLGTSTPLYTLIMVALGSLFGGSGAPFPVIALYFNALACSATCLLLWQFGRVFGSPLAGVSAALVWALAPYNVTFAVGGLETSLYVFLLTAAAYTSLQKKHTLSALACALALVTRPDALILVVPLMIHRACLALRQREPVSSIELMVFFLPLAAWYGFAWSYFGSPIPQSVTAKMVAYQLGTNASLIRLLQHYATPFASQDTLGAFGVSVGFVLYPFLYLVGALRAMRINQRTLFLILYPWLYLVIFAIPNPLIFRWYLSPPLPVYYLFILLGFENILRSVLCIKIPLIGTFWRQCLLVLLVIAIPLYATISEWQLRPDHGTNRPAPEMAWIKLELLYRRAADWLAPRIDDETLLAAGDVGVLGYYTPARILDTVGLNSPMSTSYYPLPPEKLVINYAIPADLILDQSPDWLVVLEVYVRNTLLEDERFITQYELVKSFDTDIYGSQGMLIYHKSD